MRKLLALLCWVVVLPLSAGTPCSTIDRTLTVAQKQAWAPSMAKQLQVTDVDVLQVFRQDNWRVIYVDTHRSDNGFLFYRDDPRHSRYVTVWAGSAEAGEQASIEQWVRAHVPGIPSTLAQCFAWHVTQHRDM